MALLDSNMEQLKGVVVETAYAAKASELGWAATVNCLDDELKDNLISDIDKCFSQRGDGQLWINTGEHEILRTTPLWFNGYLPVVGIGGTVPAVFDAVERSMSSVFRGMPFWIGRTVFLNCSNPGGRSPFHTDQEIRWATVVAPDNFILNMVSPNGIDARIKAESGVIVIRGDLLDSFRIRNRAVRHQFLNPKDDNTRHSVAVALS